MDNYNIFLKEEWEYLNSFKNVLKNVPLLSEKINGGQYDILGRIDLVYVYHSNQFFPDLSLCRNILDVTQTFIKHKILFSLYSEIIKMEPFIIWLREEYKNKFQIISSIMIDDNETIFSNRMKKYKDFFENLKKEGVKERIDAAYKILCRVENESNSKIRVLLNEFITKEMSYNYRLITKLEAYKYFFEHAKFKYKNKEHLIYGTLPELSRLHAKFWENLEKCRYDLNMIDVMNCFLENRDVFEQYVENHRIKNRILSTNIIKQNPHLSLEFVTERLFKYKQFLEEFKKKHGENAKKIQECINMMETVLIDYDKCEEIKSIVNEKIELNQQGKLLLSGLVYFEELPYRKKCNLFVFEKSLVFTSLRELKASIPYLDYKEHYLTKQLMQIEPNYTNHSITLVFEKVNRKNESITITEIENDNGERYVSLKDLLKCLMLVYIKESAVIFENNWKDLETKSK